MDKPDNTMSRFGNIYPTDGEEGMELRTGHYRFAPGAETFWCDNGERDAPPQDGTEVETADS